MAHLQMVHGGKEFPGGWNFILKPISSVCHTKEFKRSHFLISYWYILSKVLNTQKEKNLLFWELLTIKKIIFQIHKWNKNIFQDKQSMNQSSNVYKVIKLTKKHARKCWTTKC